MACLTFHSAINSKSPELFSIPGYHNPKPATKHSVSLPSSSSSTTYLQSSVCYNSRRYQTPIRAAASSSDTMTTEKLGIKIVKNPPESKLTELGVRSWPKWGCDPSKFPWTYSAKETCYLLKGKVKVYPEGSDEGVEIGAGDLVVFPKDMSCTWDVSETVDKHYKFE
ncbi:hypothetical protein M8C21_005527 [Ambrosia artemisiifolia]|uniref:(S)-ureidoglycine aminohydrolase cupin domain-containing protein n=1 Tax=Ambrosia artemisiifolia TaxID=4212 RepID=A0AAD5GM23_AMBAR|nr:hypothetical protein M8C21_005527 [Ambrosia artemisiifolia]